MAKVQNFSNFAVRMNSKSSFRVILTVFLALSGNLFCMAGEPQVKVELVLVTVNGDTTRLMPGDNAPSDFTAPLKAHFRSSLQADDGNEYILFPEWMVTRIHDDVSEDCLKRQENNTDYEFTDNGSYTVHYAWSYREKSAVETSSGIEIAPMSFVIRDAEISLYNAFSPNGDGFNDVYKIYVRSVVSLKIAIFNRWGQTLKTLSGRLEDILPSDVEPDGDGGFLFEVWDGTFGGRVVDDGVYFINVQAEGAGGRIFEEKSDINVLTGLGQ